MKKLTVSLPEDMIKEIKTMANQEGRSLPSIFGMGSGGTISGEKSEDWLMENWNVE